MAKASPTGRWIIEGLVIVTSILLAFGIEAWWSERQERQEEQRLLTALEAEFEVNLQHLEDARRFHSEVHESTRALLQLSSDRDRSVSADSVHHLLGDLSWWYESTSFATGAMNAVLLSGKLSLLEDEELQRELAQWQRSIDYVAAREVQDYTTYRDLWMPFLRERVNLDRVSNQIGPRPGTTRVLPPNNEPELPLRADPRTLLGDQQFHNIVLQKRWVQDDILRAYTKLEGELQEMLALIRPSRSE